MECVADQVLQAWEHCRAAIVETLETAPDRLVAQWGLFFPMDPTCAHRHEDTRDPRSSRYKRTMICRSCTYASRIFADKEAITLDCGEWKGTSLVVTDTPHPGIQLAIKEPHVYCGSESTQILILGDPLSHKVLMYYLSSFILPPLSPQLLFGYVCGGVGHLVWTQDPIATKVTSKETFGYLVVLLYAMHECNLTLTDWTIQAYDHPCEVTYQGVTVVSPVTYGLRLESGAISLGTTRVAPKEDYRPFFGVVDPRVLHCLGTNSLKTQYGVVLAWMRAYPPTKDLQIYIWDILGSVISERMAQGLELEACLRGVELDSGLVERLWQAYLL